MQLHPVESSMIQAADYDEATEPLEVVFNSGKSYRYFQAPKDMWQGLLEAGSKGSYMG
ncbi:KTSC domain-containing protein [Microcoleus sp. FACHB-672]|uniref:KTSC domain-containing protein n=1 Tax=Microcoleus sp. FACHB-672 TaxID=2692825 RepID=UPI001685CB86|nr:KTSC domain-containing protein [Microcoleus sp. FACHB-672]MBD2039293.1 KTSC domain-containing protein [Microcoleus sp. FACHB-672]